MHIHFLDPYHEGSSWLHKIDPRVKLVLVLAFILITALVPQGAWMIYFLLWLITLSLEILSGVGSGYFIKRSTLVLPFILAAFPLIFTAAGNTFFSFTIGSWNIEASTVGLIRFTSIALKSWISVQMAILLIVTTPFPDILTAMRALRIPRLLVTIFGLMWRYLFVLADEAMRLLRARAARSGTSGNSEHRSGGTLSWRAKTTGTLAGNLFLRSLERSERIHFAMLSRGYDGEIRSLPRERMQVLNWIVLGLGMMVLLVVVALSILMRA
jgi:cobalt/nickel transport system permease protein